jgi:hypothetical protein
LIKSSWVKCSWAVSTLALLCASVLSANAQAKITLADGRSVSVGGGLRTSFRTTELFPESGDYLKEFVLDSVRLYVNADVHKNISVEFNTEYGSPNSTLRVLDAVVKYSPSPYFNVWMGRHLPPSDRANLAGPYFAMPFDYPGLVSRYPAIFAGRDNGVLVNGQTGGGVFKYAGGIYDGAENVPGTSDTLLYATRLVYNFLDPEPGYYNNGTYYGDKTLFAVGFAAQHQADVVLVDGSPEPFTGMNGDLLFETKLGGGGVITLEAAAYDYDLSGAPGDGNSYLASAAYLFPKTTGIGAFQPMIRFQDFENESALDLGVNYIIRGHNARFSAVYTRSGPESFKSHNFTLGIQVQF